MKQEIEYQELKECSFKPKLSKKIGNYSKLQWEVNGMDKIREKRQKVEAKKREQTEIEDKLFHPEKNYKPRQKTVPKPFNLGQQTQYQDYIPNIQYLD